MYEIIKLLDKNFEYIKHEIEDNIMYIHVQSCNDEPKCPYCHQVSNKKHSIYIRKLQDLPIQGTKGILHFLLYPLLLPKYYAYKRFGKFLVEELLFIFWNSSSLY